MYTTKDVNSLIVDSLFSDRKTLTEREALRLLIKSKDDDIQLSQPLKDLCKKYNISYTEKTYNLLDRRNKVKIILDHFIATCDYVVNGDFIEKENLHYITGQHLNRTVIGYNIEKGIIFKQFLSNSKSITYIEIDKLYDKIFNQGA
jgi:hypothetical protein